MDFLKNIIEKNFSIVLMAVAVIGGMWLKDYMDTKKFENIERQREGKLTDTEKQLLEAKKEIGQLRSEIKGSDVLKQQLADNQRLYSENLKKFIKDNNMVVDSLTSVVAKLDNKINGGTSTVTVVSDKEIKYEWWDKRRIFHLKDPNIFTQEDEEFDYHQRFAIDMVALKQKATDGALRVQSATLNEIDDKGNIIKTAELDLENSSFQFNIEDPNCYARSSNGLYAGITHKAEVALGWEPIRLYDKTLGLSIAAFGNKDDQFLGAGIMYYPKFKWAQSEVGGGVTVGYSVNGKVGVRALLVIKFASFGK